MGACPLKHRSAQRCIGAGVKVDLAVQAGKDPVLVARKCKSSLHGVALRMEIDRLLS